MAKVIRRNLPLDTDYKLVSVFYGSLETTGACACQNCGRVITNIATIKDAKGKSWNVGLNCMETLTTDLFELEDAQAAFKERKGLIAKVRKAEKKGIDLTYRLAHYGLGVYFNERGFERLLFFKDYDFSTRMLPDLLVKVSNPEKAGWYSLKRPFEGKWSVMTDVAGVTFWKSSFDWKNANETDGDYHVQGTTRDKYFVTTFKYKGVIFDTCECYKSTLEGNIESTILAHHFNNFK